jgi:hypothetical protein
MRSVQGENTSVEDFHGTLPLYGFLIVVGDEKTACAENPAVPVKALSSVRPSDLRLWTCNCADGFGTARMVSSDPFFVIAASLFAKISGFR